MRRRQTYRTSPKAHEITKVLYAQMLADGMTEKEFCEKARIARNTLYRWKNGLANADLPSMERALGVFGLELRVKPKPAEKKLGRPPMDKKENPNGETD